MPKKDDAPNAARREHFALFVRAFRNKHFTMLEHVHISKYRSFIEACTKLSPFTFCAELKQHLPHA